MKQISDFIFDFETNGLDDCSVLSISFIICINKKVINKQTRYYFPKENYDKLAIEINGLSQEVVSKKRSNCNYPLYFCEDKKWIIDIINKHKVQCFVAHNIEFDIKFLPHEIYKKIQNNEYTKFCTMKENINFVGIKKGNSFKLPRLSEACNAHNIDFEYDKAHRSDYDTLKAFELYIATIK